MSDVNKVMISGRLTADPMLRKTPAQKNVSTFFVAVNEQALNGERITQFFHITAWGKKAEYICKYGEKGMRVFIEGTLKGTKYIKSTGEKVETISIIVNDVTLLSSKQNKENSVSYGGSGNIGEEKYSPVKSDYTLPY